MQVDECSLALGIFLGAVVAAFLLAGYYGQRDARARMRKLDAERKRAGEALKKARLEREKGCAALPGAVLLFLMGIFLFVLLIYVLLAGQL